MTKPLNAAQRAELEGLLSTRLQAMQEQVAAHRQNLSRADHASDLLAQDADDAPQRASDREVDQALSDIDQQLLTALTRALSRIHDADFGLCTDCESTIPFARLEVEPEALRCVACQAVHERKH
jgi:DnaK suppressor protein